MAHGLRKVRHRCEFPLLLRLTNAVDICEVGVNRGRHLKWLAESDASHIHAVDTWHGMFELPTEDHLQDLIDWTIRRQERNRFHFHVGKSVNVAKELAKQGLSFDFIYLDADHAYESVIDDILVWWPLVREGGCLAGHNGLCSADPRKEREGVVAAVNEFVAILAEQLGVVPWAQDLLCSSWWIQKCL